MPDDIPSIAEFSQLVGSIYDCALDPTRWAEAVHGICDSANCVRGIVHVVDMTTGGLRLQEHWNWTPEWFEAASRYGPEIAAILSGVPQLYSRPLDEPFSVMRDVPALLHSRYYKEWIRPHRVIDGIQINLLRQRDRIGALALSRHEDAGVITDRELAIARLLAPHIRRAVVISDAIDMRAVTIGTFEASLDLIATSVVLADASARIIHANRAAQAMLDAGSPIRSDRGELRAHLPETTAALKTAIARCTGNEVTIGATGIGIPAPRADGEPMLIHALPLASGDLRGRIAPGASAALFVTPARDGVGAPPAALAALFDLSPAETRTLERVIAGDTLAEAADKLGVALTTVRTHLAHIFEKTGASRQAELIHLAAKFSPPSGSRSGS
jgi:DNA-binding CsgD family transcriptional regulator